MNVLLLLGPNLSALGKRDPHLYGPETLEDIVGELEKHAGDLGHQLSWQQSEHEGDLIEALLGAGGAGHQAVIINPGALSHYSYALRDAVEACGLPVVEVHQSNIYAREEFRQHSVISATCRVVIAGAGAGGYHLALEALPWIST